jgi:glycolate oxidase iron-sulfur subunit
MNVVFRFVFGEMRLFRFAVTVLRTYQRSVLRRIVRKSGLLRALRLDEIERLLPPIAATFVVPNGQRWTPALRVGESRRVALFTGCVMSTICAPTTKATVRVLVRNGSSVMAPAGQGCCGALALHAGLLEVGREAARRNIAAFSPGDESIIVNAAGCGAMLKGYAHLLQDDAAWTMRARAFSARVRDVTEYVDSREVVPTATRVVVHITYQEPCHLAHAQGITRQPRDLLRSISGVELVEMQESSMCCGSAGIYNVTNPVMATRLLERKLDHALATRPDVIATANPGCALWLQAGLARRGAQVRVAHVVDLLDECYGSGLTMRYNGAPFSKL